MYIDVFSLNIFYVSTLHFVYWWFVMNSNHVPSEISFLIETIVFGLILLIEFVSKIKSASCKHVLKVNVACA